MKLLIVTVAAILTLGVGSASAHDAVHGKKVVTAEQKAFGISGNPARTARTIRVSMTDAMRFEPAHIRVKLGETVKFVLKNNGQLMHEMVLGTMKELREHAEMMKKHPDMHHEEPHMVHVPPGKTGEIVWHFNRAGQFDFACLIAGHFDAGMVGKIAVE